jgi:hypothetical protein
MLSLPWPVEEGRKRWREVVVEWIHVWAEAGHARSSCSGEWYKDLLFT